MTQALWPTPSPKPPELLSATLGEDLRACPRRVAFSMDPKFSSLKRMSQYAAPGIVAHSVYERVATGSYNYPPDADEKDVLEDIWAQEVDRTHERLALSWAPAVVPEPQMWPRMAQTRRSVFRSQNSLLKPSTIHQVASTSHSSQNSSSASTHDGPQVDSSRKLDPLPWVEVELLDKELGLVGTPDRVERRRDGVWVLDLKSGWAQADPTDAQRRQLLLYVHLVEVNLGERPVGAAIDARKGLFPLTWNETDVEILVEDMVKLGKTFAEDAKEGDELIANPAAETCRWCPYRAVCEPAAVALTEEDRLPLVVTGTVTGVGDVGGKQTVDFDIASPNWLPVPSARVIDVAWGSLPDVGDWIAMSNIHVSGDGRTLSGSWDTRTYTWKPDRTEC